MKAAFAILLLIGLLASPLGCLAACPHHAHECCSTPVSSAICPYDILSLAKAALPVVATPSIEPAHALIIAVSPQWFETRIVDSNDLHLANRVLRI